MGGRTSLGCTHRSVIESEIDSSVPFMITTLSRLTGMWTGCMREQEGTSKMCHYCKIVSFSNSATERDCEPVKPEPSGRDSNLFRSKVRSMQYPLNL